MHGNSRYVNIVVDVKQALMCSDDCSGGFVRSTALECGSPTAVRTPTIEYTASPAVVQEPSRSVRDIAQELGLSQLQIFSSA
jgi:hypothetical protein